VGRVRFTCRNAVNQRYSSGINAARQIVTTLSAGGALLRLLLSTLGFVEFDLHLAAVEGCPSLGFVLAESIGAVDREELCLALTVFV